MKASFWILLLLLAAMWLVFFYWYSDMELMEASMRSRLVRYDFIFLPINLCVTAITIWVMVKMREH